MVGAPEEDGVDDTRPRDDGKPSSGAVRPSTSRPGEKLGDPGLPVGAVIHPVVSSSLSFGRRAVPGSLSLLVLEAGRPVGRDGGSRTGNEIDSLDPSVVRVSVPSEGYHVWRGPLMTTSTEVSPPCVGSCLLRKDPLTGGGEVTDDQSLVPLTRRVRRSLKLGKSGNVEVSRGTPSSC